MGTAINEEPSPLGSGSVLGKTEPILMLRLLNPEYCNVLIHGKVVYSSFDMRAQREKFALRNGVSS